MSCQISATVLSADFHKDRLSGSDFYRFVSTDLPFTAIGELRRSGSTSSELDEILFITSGISDQEVVSSLNRVMPPDRFQNIIEQALDEIVPYIAGDRDEFTLRVEVKESGETDAFDMRLEISEIARRGADEAKDLLQEAGAYDVIYEDILEPTIADRLFETFGGQSAVDILERVLNALSGDLVCTEHDLLSLIESELGHEGLQGFQQSRAWVSRFQSLRWLAWVPVVVLLISIGLLGGRNWPVRVSWAAAYLIGVAALLFAAFQALSSTWNRWVEDARIDALGQIDASSHFPLTQELIID